MTPEEQARFEEIERRLAAVEAQLATKQPVAQAFPAVSISAPEPEQPEPQPPQVHTDHGSTLGLGRASVLPPEQGEGATLETTFGLTWLSRIAVVTVVLALAFFFEWAFENHWITPPARVGLGLACGALVATGLGSDAGIADLEQVLALAESETAESETAEAERETAWRK